MLSMLTLVKPSSGIYSRDKIAFRIWFQEIAGNGKRAPPMGSAFVSAPRKLLCTTVLSMKPSRNAVVCALLARDDPSGVPVFLGGGQGTDLERLKMCYIILYHAV